MSSLHTKGFKDVRNVHALLRPETYYCACEREPVIVIEDHPDTGKRGFYVVRCQCGNHSIHAKELYKAVIDWNKKPISTIPERLQFPGLSLEGMDLCDALAAIRAEAAQIDQALAYNDKAKHTKEQWQVLKIKREWCQMLLCVGKRLRKAIANA